MGTVTFFQDMDLLQPAPVALLTCERGSQIGVDELAGQLGTDHTPAQYQDVHIVVFDSLVGRIRIVTEPGTNARQLVGRHRRPTPLPQISTPRSA